MSEWNSQLAFLIQHFNAMEGWINGELIYAMFQRIGVMFIIAFLFSKSKAFELLIKNSMRSIDWLKLYVIFTAISMTGSILGDLVILKDETNDWQQVSICHIQPAIFPKETTLDCPEGKVATIQVESRAIGAVLAGFLGGPLLGFLVGASAGAFRLLMEGDAAVAGAIGTTLAGLLAGLFYWVILKMHPEQRFNWKWVFIITCLGELVMKGIVIYTNAPLAKGIALIKITMLPNTIGNGLGAALFVSILSDSDRVGRVSSEKAFRMADRFARFFKRKMPTKLTARYIAKTLQRETGAAAVAMTSNCDLLAFVGMASNHHRIGDEIAIELINEVIETKTTKYLDGYDDHFHCKSDSCCPLHSALIIPIIVTGKVEGCILLFEPKHVFFPKISRELGVSLARLLSTHILTSRYHDQLVETKMKQLQTDQKAKLIQANTELKYQLIKLKQTDTELKYLYSKVDPHFFANSLNTISEITRSDVKDARMLIGLLAELMRERVTPADHVNTLKYEAEFLEKYLIIEKRRFGDRLETVIDIDESIETALVPQFILQLIVENAIKHGISTIIAPGVGRVEVHAYPVEHELMHISIKDNAGAFYDNENKPSKGAGMKMVNELIQSQFNSNSYGIEVECQEDEYTLIKMVLPIVFNHKQQKGAL
ncbi:MAG: histidine kinase [Methylococcales bacterium]|nr:histidine kinase [Methylococcales bacterium]